MRADFIPTINGLWEWTLSDGDTTIAHSCAAFRWEAECSARWEAFRYLYWPRKARSPYTKHIARRQEPK